MLHLKNDSDFFVNWELGIMSYELARLWRVMSYEL